MKIRHFARSRTLRQVLSSWHRSTLLAALLSLLAAGCGAPKTSSPEILRGNVDEFATRIASLGGRAEVNVDLAFTDVTDDNLATLTFPDTVTQLDLRNTNITDEGLVYLKKIRNLERLNLSSTRVSDAGLDHLRELPSLCFLELHNSLVSPQKQLEILKELIPRRDALIARRTAAAAKHLPPFQH